MEKFELISKKELEKLGKRTQTFFIALFLALILLYAQSKFFQSPVKSERLSGQISPPSLSTASPTPHLISFRDGDIVFQEAEGDLARKVSRATGSPLNHCGLIMVKDGKAFVLESGGNAEPSGLREWIANGSGKKFALARVKNLKEADAARVVEEGKKLTGRPYDYQYQWDDEKIYCSELVFKAFKRGAGIDLGKFQTLKELNCKGMEDYLGKVYDGRIPLNLKLVSPVKIYNCPLLEKVYDDFAPPTPL